MYINNSLYALKFNFGNASNSQYGLFLIILEFINKCFYL
jgi:hypothetical protein